MSAREKWFARCLQAYPQAYRTEREGEFLATLIESSESASWWVVAADGLDVIGSGLRKRMGAGADDYLGRVLMLAALPSFVVAACFSAVLFAFGEFRPIHVTTTAFIATPHVSPLPLVKHFGPFQTDGAVAFLAWMIGGLLAFAQPHYQRGLAAVCILLTVLSVPLGAVYFGRPLLLVVVALVGLGLPALLAPRPDWRQRPNRAAAASTGVVALVILLLAAAGIDAVHAPPGAPFSPPELYRIGQFMPYVALALLVSGVVLCVMHRSDWLGAILAVVAPWFVIAALTRAAVRWSERWEDALFLGLSAVWIGVSWGRDLSRRPTSTLERG